MAKTMKAAVVQEFKKPLTIEEVPIPEPKPGEILVKLRACGVCGTDLHALDGDWPDKPKPPFIPGHEGTGHVAAVGAGVDYVKEGDPVGVPWLHTADGHCDYCWSGWESLCKAQTNTGYSVDGCFAEYVLADPNYVARLPPNVDFVEVAPILCAGVTVYKGLKMTEARPGDWVVISGIGGLGHVAIQYAKSMGMHVAAVDISDAKLELAREVGASIAVNARTTDPTAYLQKEVGGAHAVLVTAPSHIAFEQALAMVRRRGTITLIGMPPGSFPLPIVPMVLDAITLRGSIVGGRLDLEEARSPSPSRARSRRPFHATSSRTSTAFSSGCATGRSRDVSCFRSGADSMCTVGTYLARRFEDVGLRHYFMVPGDYNLVLLDELLRNKHLKQVGCCNELNAAYAAEGYARANGVGALVVTFNVGALSAVNGVAGAYAERLPVIFVSAGYNTNDPVANHLVHHSLGTHDLSYQYEMLRQVTCAAVRILHPENAPGLIDHAFRTALRERKPAYIEIACNLVTASCAEPPPFETVSMSEPSSPAALAAAASTSASLLDDARRPLLLAGPLLRAYGAVDAFRELAEALGCAVAVMPAAKGLFPEDHPQFIGIYWGGVSSPGCEPIVDWADMVLAAGPMFTDYTTVGWTAAPARERLIDAGPRSVRCPHTEYTDVALADFLSSLVRRVRKNDATLMQYRREAQRVPTEMRPRPDGETGARADVPLTRSELFRQIENTLDEKTTLLVETGDSWFNGMYLHLPAGARFEIEMQWGSIGWAVPASFGYAMGLDASRRLISVIGDGAFQLTAQEVANMIRHNQKTIIFLVNNRGYVIESEIHDGPYNYIKNWDYAGLIAVWNAEDGHGLGLKATTSGELDRAIERARLYEGGPVLIECQIGHDDCSPQLLKWGTRVALANERPSSHTEREPTRHGE